MATLLYFNNKSKAKSVVFFVVNFVQNLVFMMHTNQTKFYTFASFLI